MSEYQYFEFQAIDRPLAREQIAELRRFSSRATITPTRFQNVYHWGDFRGDPLTVLGTYFDAFVYVANWGTNQLMLRLPRALLDARVWQPYVIDGFVDVHERDEWLIVEFISQDEEGMDWIEDEEAESWMPALLPLRADLAAGDPRALYLAWLAGARAGMLDDDEREPPVPPGLNDLTAPLIALAQFLRLDDDLRAIASTASAALPPPPAAADLRRWVAGLPAAEKDNLLARVVECVGSPVRAELVARFRSASAPLVAARPGERTVGELLAAADGVAEVRRRLEAEREAAARAAYLDGLAGREDELWRQVDALIEMKRAKEYDQAVALLTDLRDLGAHQGKAGAFAARIDALRRRYANRPALLTRFDQAGL